MKKDHVHDFFHNISRITIILPIIIIAVGIIIKPSKQAKPQVQSSQSVTAPSTVPTSKPSTAPLGSSINLQGPLICTLDSQSEYNGLLYIKNKNIYADMRPINENKNVSILLKGDCIYKWESGAKTGQRICEISQYVSILDTMAKFNILDAETLMTLVTQFGTANGAGNLPKNIPATTCKKDTISDSIFEIPKTVQFQLKTAVSPAPPSR